MTVTPTDAGVLVSVAASATSGGASFLGTLLSRCALSGDFDIRVDYQLLTWPAKSGVRTGIEVANLGGVERDSLAASDVATTPPATGSEVYLADLKVTPFPVVATADTNGTLRVTRTGSTWTAFFASGSGWTSVYSAVLAGETGPVTPDFASWSNPLFFNHVATVVSFRNYVVSAGQCTCPDAGP